MKFISVRRLAAVFKLEVSRTNEDLIKGLRNSIDQHFLENQILSAFGQDFTFQQLDFILNQLEEENAFIFHDWVENDHLLVEYLFSKGEIVLPDEELKFPNENQSYTAYQDFLSIYLEPILSTKTIYYIKEGNLAQLGEHLKFSSLLPEKNRIANQKPVSYYLKQLLAQTKVSQGKELYEQLKLVYSHEYVVVLNRLDNNLYDDLLTYFNTAKLIVQRNDLSPMILDRIKSSISELNLKEEDHEKALAFMNAKSFNSRSKKPQSRLNEMVKSPFFIVAVIVIVLNLVFFECEREKEEIKPSENVSETLVKNKFPYIIDTFNFEASNKILQERNFSNYRPLYFGVKSDTLYSDYNLVSYAFGEATIFQFLEDKETMKQNKILTDLFNENWGELF